MILKDATEFVGAVIFGHQEGITEFGDWWFVVNRGLLLEGL